MAPETCAGLHGSPGISCAFSKICRAGGTLLEALEMAFPFPVA